MYPFSRANCVIRPADSVKNISPSTLSRYICRNCDRAEYSASLGIWTLSATHQLWCTTIVSHACRRSLQRPHSRDGHFLSSLQVTIDPRYALGSGFLDTASNLAPLHGWEIKWFSWELKELSLYSILPFIPQSRTVASRTCKVDSMSTFSHWIFFLELTSRGALRCVTGRSGARKCFFLGPSPPQLPYALPRAGRIAPQLRRPPSCFCGSSSPFLFRILFYISRLPWSAERFRVWRLVLWFNPDWFGHGQFVSSRPSMTWTMK